MNARSVRARRERRWLAAIVPFVGLLFAFGETAAGEAPISVGEVATPAAATGIDATLLRAAATDEINQIDVSRLPNRRKVVVSLAVTKAVSEKTIACTVNAMLRDAETGVMLAIIEAGAQAEGPGSIELRKQVANAAVRSAVRRIPRALGGK